MRTISDCTNYTDDKLHNILNVVVLSANGDGQIHIIGSYLINSIEFDCHRRGLIGARGIYREHALTYSKLHDM